MVVQERLDVIVKDLRKRYQDFLKENRSEKEIKAEKFKLIREFNAKYETIVDEIEKERFAPLLEEMEKVKSEFKINTD